MRTTVKGKFITIEGVEGVGKSTNIANIEAFLTAQGIDFIRTREPGGTVIAEKYASYYSTLTLNQWAN